MVNAGFFWQGPLHNSFCDPSTPFLFAQQTPVPTVSTRWPSAVFFEAGSHRIQADLEFTMCVTEDGLELDPVFTSAGWSCRLSP